MGFYPQHLALLGGAALAVVPVVLHLIMRQQPRHLEFPALRFLRSRHETNRRILRLRQWLLLGCRMAAIAVLAAALSRPNSVPLAKTSGGEVAEMAAVFVFDTLPPLDYRSHNQTRLEAARELAIGLLERLPEKSQVAVLDSRASRPVSLGELGNVLTARERIDNLRTNGRGSPVWEVVAAAADLLGPNQQRRELYVFTDLQRSAWHADSVAQQTAELARLRGANVYLIDVGLTEPRNAGLGELQLSEQILAKNRPLRIDVTVINSGPANRRTARCFLLDGDRPPKSVGQQPLELAADGTAAAEFHLPALEPGTHQGFVHLSGDDPLANDDLRFFTVDVRSAWKVLVVAPSPAEEQAYFFTKALAPPAFRTSGQARFDCTVVRYEDLPADELDQYRAVFLLDPPPLTDGAWVALHAYATDGGSVGIFLGDHARPIEFNRPAPQMLLPGPLEFRARYDEDEMCLAPKASEHPLLARFRPLRGSIDWQAFDVFSYWRLKKLASDAAIVIAYLNGEPAMIERTIGRGRVITMTTPVSEATDLPAGDRWNKLATGFEPWPFVMLANETAFYLVGSNEGQLNFLTGDNAVIAADARYSTYLVSELPSLPEVRSSAPALRLSRDPKQNTLALTADTPGNFRVAAGPQKNGFQRGFCVNLPAAVGPLTRITEAELREAFGDVSFRVARDRAAVEREVSADRDGFEWFPYLIVAVALALALEHWLGNRFYRDSG